jgi:hypothetical protein
MTRSPILLTLPLAWLGACSDPGGPPAGADAGGGEADAAPGDYVPLLAGDWTMPGGEEGYYCVRRTVSEELFIREYKPISPAGTHHTALSIDSAGGADGTFPCDAGTIGFQLLSGSGVGTTPFALPDGVAYKVPAGTTLLLNLHLYNAGEDMLTGRSGVEVKLADPADVVHEASTVYVIDTNLTVPQGPSQKTVRCTLSDDATIFGAFPHMHRMGVHMTAALAPGGGAAATFLDTDYDFEQQLNHHVDPMLEVHAGDVVTGVCGYDNTSDHEIHFGDSSDDEMCVLGLYRYPPKSGPSVCGN